MITKFVKRAGFGTEYTVICDGVDIGIIYKTQNGDWSIKGTTKGYNTPRYGTRAAAAAAIR